MSGALGNMDYCLVRLGYTFGVGGSEFGPAGCGLFLFYSLVEVVF